MPMPDLNVTISDLTGALLTQRCKVTIQGSGSSRSEETSTGSYLFVGVTADTYAVTVVADWYAQFDKVSVVVGESNASGAVQMMLDTIFSLHVDGDRNGKVDDDPPSDTWEYGPGKKGAIVFCNTDDDGGRGNLFYDADDDVVNTANDEPDIAPLTVRRDSATVPVSVTLSITAGIGYLRIFNGIKNGAREVLGPTAGSTLAIDASLIVTNTSLAYGMEANSFACDAWDGLAKIALKVERKSVFDAFPTISRTTTAAVRVAPWIMTHHLNRLNRVFMAETSFNDETRTEVFRLLALDGIAYVAPQYEDQWLQDCMKIGYSTIPRPGDTIHRVADILLADRTGPDRFLYPFPITLRGPERTYFDPAETSLAAFEHLRFSREPGLHASGEG
jgi:hypothetical protein